MFCEAGKCNVGKSDSLVVDIVGLLCNRSSWIDAGLLRFFRVLARVLAFENCSDYFKCHISVVGQFLIFVTKNLAEDKSKSNHFIYICMGTLMH